MMGQQQKPPIIHLWWEGGGGEGAGRGVVGSSKKYKYQFGEEEKSELVRGKGGYGPTKWTRFFLYKICTS